MDQEATQGSSLIHSFLDIYECLLYFRECAHRKRRLLPSKNSHDSSGVGNTFVNKLDNFRVISTTTKKKEDDVIEWGGEEAILDNEAWEGLSIVVRVKPRPE